MATKKDKKFRSKFFRVAVEGATCDGRNIERQDIEDMAATYDPVVYGARIWMEHIRGILADSAFRAYGDVLALKSEEVDINGSKKLALFAQIQPTDDLINMVNVLKQKMFTSIEIAPKFADSGKAYLCGLAVTDSPASLGTEMLTFAAQLDKNPLNDRKQQPENLFSAAAETTIEFEEVEQPAPRQSKFANLFKTLGIKPKPEPEPKEDDAPDFAAFCTQLAETVDAQDEEIESLKQKVALGDGRLKEFCTQLAALAKVLNETPQSYTQRPVVTGKSGDDATDC
ncbi:GPO family capsid scaffolding protein [Stenotrophomonas sp. Iso1]|uniref:GPO family capsid scaffolding protein n=1 Tax=Stenotrophomonas sp. Iso1 TaxID=2977283 RepID=UPI0022B7D6AF|nr:GPO family capsid scaffolding protein [Stenotrophomonas sp. Iso1]